MIFGKVELVTPAAVLQLEVCKTLVHLVRVVTSFFLVYYNVGSKRIISERVNIQPVRHEVKIQRYRRMAALNLGLPAEFHVWH